MSSSVHSLIRWPQPGISNIAGDFPVDKIVVSYLPKEAKVLAVDRYRSSTWTVTARILTEMPDSTLQRYFLKCATEDIGYTMIGGEYSAMLELHKIIPSGVPSPIAGGKFEEENPPTYFLLSDFVDMANEDPDPQKLCTLILDLHAKSSSPTGKFGFHIRTCNGRISQAVEWESSWMKCFINMIIHVMNEDLRINGPWPELERVEETVITQVIPKLIGALEREGRSVKPCLIHGNLWEGNIRTSIHGGEILLFGASSFYAHNEMELGAWRCPYNKISADTYVDTYLLLQAPCSPVDEWDDRTLMYSVYFDLLYSANNMRKGRGVRRL